MAMLGEIEYLYQALASPIGIVLEVSDVGIAQQRLYKARRDSGDPELDRLQLRRSPFLPESELWVVKGPRKDR
jgi:hypothetical protein